MAFTLPIWEIETTGDDTNNGGGFDTGVAGFPTDLKSINSLGTTSAPVVSSASYDFVAGDVNNWVFIKSGTNWLPGWYKITAVNIGVSPHTATLDATIGHAVTYSSSVIGRTSGPNTVAGVVNSSYTNGTASGTWGLDYSQNGVGFTSATGFSTDSTNTHLLDSNNTIGKNWVGNIISINTAGTGFTIQRVAVASTSGTTATCDKTLGGTNLSGGGGNLGGAFASLGKARSVGAINNQALWIKSGSYTITSASTNVAAGCYTASGVTARIEGYNTVRGDMGTAPVHTASGINTFTFITPTTSDLIRNITFDGAGSTSSRGFITALLTEKCTAKNCTNNGINTNGNNLQLILNCVATGCSIQVAFGGTSDTATLMGCVAYNNTAGGFACQSTNSNAFVCCISSGNTGVGFNATTGGHAYINCTAYNNSSDGYVLTASASTAYFLNCIAESNGGWGFNETSGGGNAGGYIDYCGTKGNTSGAINFASTDTAAPFFIGSHNVAYSASAFQGAGSNNFALNQNPNGGMKLRGNGFPGTFTTIGITGFIDIGAVQAPFAKPGQGGIGFFIQ